MDDTQSPPSQNKPDQPDSQEFAVPSLEEILDSTPARKQQTRSRLGSKLACALVGFPVELVKGKETWELVERPSRLPLVHHAGQLRRVDPGGELGEEVNARAAGFATLLLRMADPSNHLAGILTHKDSAGQAEPFLGGSCAHSWSLRLDPNWTTTMRARSRAKARERFRHLLATLPAEEKALREKTWWDRGKQKWERPANRLMDVLLTLTQPHRPGSKSLDQLQVYNLAWREFTRSNLYIEKVYGGIKGVENKLDPDGPHVHGHNLLITRFLPWWEVQREWWHQLNSAWLKVYEQPMEYMPGGLPIVDIRLVKKRIKAEKPPRKNGTILPGIISLDGALDEVSKYITKTTDLLKPDKQGRTITSETLLELCEIERWPRMFELLGKCRAYKAAKRLSAFVHTSCISVSEAFRDALTQARELEEGPAPEPLPLEKVWTRQTSYRRTVLDDGTVIMEREEVTERDQIHWQWNHGAERMEAKQKARPPTWRQLMAQLAFPDWLHLMMGRAEAGYQFRLKWILEHNPTCFLVDLRGKCVANQQPQEA